MHLVLIFTVAISDGLATHSICLKDLTSEETGDKNSFSFHHLSLANTYFYFL